MKSGCLHITAAGDTLCSERDGSVLTNFSFRAVQPFFSPAHGEELSAIAVEIFHMGKYFTAILDVRVGNLTGQITHKFPTCRLLQPSWRSTIDAYLIACGEGIRNESSPIYLRQHGLCRLTSGRWIYVAGDDVLGMPDGLRCEIAETVSRAHLAWDSALPVQACVSAFCARIEQYDQILMPVWAFTIFSSLRSAVHQLNLTTLPTLAILGGRNLGKTTVAQRYMLLYDDRQRPGRCLAQLDAHSTVAATIGQVQQFRDQVVLVDDLARSASPAEQRARLDLIAEILRFSSNDVDRLRMSPRKQTEARFCQAGVAFTGEFHLRNPSDLTRLVIVDIRQQMRGGNPADRTLAATTFHHLMVWLLPRLDEELDSLRQSLDAVTDGENLRLRKNRMVLLWTLRLFYLFACCAGAVTESYALQAARNAGEILDNLLAHQAQAVEQLTLPVPAGNLSWYILRGYQNHMFHIVSRKKVQSEEDCVIERDALCVCAGTLLAYFHTNTPYCQLSRHEMNRQLMEEGAITQGREARSARKRIKGRRYLELSFTALRKAAHAY